MKKLNTGRLYMHAIMMAEELFPEPKSGKKKRAWVVDLINDKINIPLLNERQEKRLIGLLVDVLVDLWRDDLSVFKRGEQ